MFNFLKEVYNTQAAEQVLPFGKSITKKDKSVTGNFKMVLEQCAVLPE